MGQYSLAWAYKAFIRAALLPVLLLAIDFILSNTQLDAGLGIGPRCQL
jgi:hypothetical protein